MNPKDKFNIRVRAQAVRDHRSGMPIAEVARRHGASVASVRNWIANGDKILADADLEIADVRSIAASAVQSMQSLQSAAVAHDDIHELRAKLEAAHDIILQHERSSTTFAEQSHSLQRENAKQRLEIETLSRMVEVLLARRS